MENTIFNHTEKCSPHAVRRALILQLYFYWIILFFLLLPVTLMAQEKWWEQNYDILKAKIDRNFSKPVSAPFLDIWLQWMDLKAMDRDRVHELLSEANKLYMAHPDNKSYSLWVTKLLELEQRAEDSGDNTVNEALLKYLRSDDKWSINVLRVHDYGRKIYTRAKEDGFSTKYTVEFSKCLLNHALVLLESDETNLSSPFSGSGFSLYDDRLLLFGVLTNVEGWDAISVPDYEFNVPCEGRKLFVRWTEGKPDKTIMYAFTNVDKIREETKWWGFGEIWQDATDLMNEYYEDALCKIPPHDSKLGHKYFLQLAEEKNLEKSINYNKGFYGTLYGKVEIVVDDEKKPAPGAKVTVEDYDETWTTTADENGKYKIEHVILHKDCSPFDIHARYKGYQVDDTYDGPLTKPDSTARFRKDLLIDSGLKYKWFGNLTALLAKNSQCLKNVQKDFTLEQARLTLRAQHIDISQPVISLDLGDLDFSGSVSGKYEYAVEEEGGDDRHYKHVIKNMHGQNVFRITKDNPLNIEIISEKLMDQDAMKQMEEMARKVASGNLSEEEIEKIAGQMENQMSDDRKSFPVRVIIQLDGNWRGKVSTYEYIRETENGKVVENKENNGAVIMDLAGPIALELKGTCTKNDDGTVSIRAEMHETKKDPDCVQISNNATFTIRSTIEKN